MPVRCGDREALLSRAGRGDRQPFVYGHTPQPPLSLRRWGGQPVRLTKKRFRRRFCDRPFDG
jgi:hypothetical protein